MRWLLFVLLVKTFALDAMQHFVLDEKKRPTPELLALVELLEPGAHASTLSEIVTLTQKTWYQAGKERWQLEPRYPDKEKQAFALLEKLGCISAIQAQKMHYNYALLLGGWTPRMQRRINFLIETWKRGVRFDKVVLLTGQRILDKSEKTPPGITTETEMFVHLFKNCKMPDELRNLPFFVIDTPMQNGKRPKTADTIVAWLQTGPSFGSCLAIGDQPFAGYFDAVFRTHLPSSYSIEVAACKTDKRYSLALYLDNLARWLYQEKEVAK